MPTSVENKVQSPCEYPWRGVRCCQHPDGSLIALFGSFDTLEIARVNGRADRGPQGQPLPLGLAVEVRLWH